MREREEGCVWGLGQERNLAVFCMCGQHFFRQKHFMINNKWLVFYKEYEPTVTITDAKADCAEIYK